MATEGMALRLRRAGARLRDHSGESAELARNSVVLQAVSGMVFLLGFIQSVIVARCLGVYDFGLICLTFAFVGIVNQIVDFRAWELVSNHVSASLARKDLVSARSALRFSVLLSI